MRVYCNECGAKARIATRESISAVFTKLYCQCLDAKGCGHRFVMHLTFSHTLIPAAEPLDRILFDRLREMPRHQQVELFNQLGALL
ncbi:ogr/Delta-like zinc finger family protein [Pseudomonas aeruginosa]|uniref:ogr/Delta-like zinc finger family protein n=1 Tax=Pseudomonas aeruginosa TaxID=287 RepID=UPI0015EFF350|nr:ogr/Delta-like zinc finger family protein [Pseudomonas aeruginosa]MBA5137396.1 ogr/Delta-like zinc finger family protein [Pseudomonas aeruginosa]MBH9008105.1 ogr/Delta-like zinc finger family protein [Pseudomonas aeruginosa]MBX6032249.1 ogr/Delta-like zinc finger family protein [Pseudomonas aeruginosa]WHV77855.1 ogr/Delta-like zinc finger family protein [Pseudomonas aeruginosa]HBO8873316.1 ogr/Delta-like zinc finger family protein [Pseudomonas aeruginosa]